MMDDYVVGSVAAFISNGSSKLKPKKKQLKLTNEESNSKQSQITDIMFSADNNLKLSNSHFKLKNQNTNKKVLSSEKFGKGHFSTKTVSVDTPIKCDDDISLQDKIDLPTKKRKKSLEESVSNAKRTEKLPEQKVPKIELTDLDHVPTDSEEDDVEREKISADKRKISSKIIEKKDFNENTIFIGNIPIKYDKQKICKLFSKFGEIQSARIRCVPIADINTSKKVAAIKKEFNPKRNSLVAYVKFKSPESVSAALKANGMVIDGHHLRIDSVEENEDRDNNKAVFVGGLPFDIEDDELWEFFQNCGKIKSVRVIRDAQFSMGKGFGYVNFDSTASVELALQLNGQELKKRTINVKRCIKARNKNKLNSFGKRKSKEISNQLLSKKSKKFKEERKKFKEERKKFKEKRKNCKKESSLLSNDFQGKKANIKQKKKKKLSKAALHQKKLIKIFNPS